MMDEGNIFLLALWVIVFFACFGLFNGGGHGGA